MTSEIPFELVALALRHELSKYIGLVITPMVKSMIQTHLDQVFIKLQNEETMVWSDMHEDYIIGIRIIDNDIEHGRRTGGRVLNLYPITRNPQEYDLL